MASIPFLYDVRRRVTAARGVISRHVAVINSRIHKARNDSSARVTGS
jgi:hypothetical protein